MTHPAAGSLRKLLLNGNQLQQLPASIGALTNLQELFLQANRLRCVPDELLQLTVTLLSPA